MIPEHMLDDIQFMEHRMADKQDEASMMAAAVLRYEEVDHWKYHLTPDTGTLSWQTRVFPSEDIVTPRITLTKGGLLTCKIWFAWNGASWFPDIPKVKRGAMFHDALFALIRAGLLDKMWLKEANQVIYDVCRDAGMAKWLAKMVRKGVNTFGKAASKRKERVILSAP